MPSVCYGQSFPAVVYGDLSRKRQHAGGQGVPVQLDAHCVCLQQTLSPVVTEGEVSEERQPVAVALAHQGEEQVAPGSQEDQGGPAGHLQVMPQARLAVVHYRVADVIAEHSAPDVVEDL